MSVLNAVFSKSSQARGVKIAAETCRNILFSDDDCRGYNTLFGRILRCADRKMLQDARASRWYFGAIVTDVSHHEDEKT